MVLVLTIIIITHLTDAMGRIFSDVTLKSLGISAFSTSDPFVELASPRLIKPKRAPQEIRSTLHCNMVQESQSSRELRCFYAHFFRFGTLRNIVRPA